MATILGQTIVYPWEVKYDREAQRVEGFDGSPADFESVLWNLDRLKYPFEKWRKKKPEARVVKACDRVFESLDVRMKKDKLPWLLVVSESMPMLQAIAKIAPMAWALTMKRSCFNVSTVELVDLFSTRRPFDDFEHDPAGETLHDIRKTSFLVWDDINATIDGAMKYSGRFRNLLTARFETARPTLFLSYMPEGFSEAAAKQMMNRIGKYYGTAVQGILEQAEKRHFMVREPMQKWEGDAF